MDLILANFEHANIDEALKRLTDAQKQRYGAANSEKRRLQFAWSRVIYNGLMRRITGAFPTFELVASQPHPSFEHNGQTYYSSISHTGNWVAVAFDTHPIAIDLETMKPRQWQQLSELTFNDNTIEWIRESASPLEAFYLMWGQRECEIKMQSYPIDARLFRGSKIKTQPYDLMLTCLSDPQSKWKPILLPTTLLENF